MKTILNLMVLFTTVQFVTCSGNDNNQYTELNKKMNQIAEQYVKLVLKTGQFDSDYVDEIEIVICEDDSPKRREIKNAMLPHFIRYTVYGIRHTPTVTPAA